MFELHDAAHCHLFSCFDLARFHACGDEGADTINNEMIVRRDEGSRLSAHHERGASSLHAGGEQFAMINGGFDGTTAEVYSSDGRQLG